MHKKHFYFSLLLLSILLSSCTSTFMGSVFVYTFSDIIYYVFIAFLIALVIGMLSRENFRKNFWIWFLLNIVLTPLPGFIFLLVKVIGKK